MGDFEVQDWMELAVSDQEDLSHVRVRKADQFEDELAILAGHLPPANALSTAAHSSDEEPSQQYAKNQQYRLRDNLPVEVVDPCKESDEKLLLQLFSGIGWLRVGVQTLVTGRRPMNHPQHFQHEAQKLGEKLTENHPQESTIEQFAEELLLSIYSSLASNDIQSLCQKLKVLRYDKKQDDRQKKKMNRVKPKRRDNHATGQKPFM